MFDHAVEDERGQSRERHYGRGDDVRCEGCEHGCGAGVFEWSLTLHARARSSMRWSTRQVINHRLGGHLEVREC